MKSIASLAAIKLIKPKPLTQQTHEAMQKILKNFTLNNTHLIYHYKFAANNYLQTLERMHRIGLIADEMDHHPEWTLNGNSLIIGLSTHQIGNQVSMKDYMLGFWIQTILNQKSIQAQVVQMWNKLQINYGSTGSNQNDIESQKDKQQNSQGVDKVKDNQAKSQN